MDALDDRDEERARRRLLRGYLPALREMAAGIDPERITAEMDVIEKRLERGLEMTDDPPYRDDAGRLRYTYVHEGDDVDDLFDELIAEYEMLFDAASLQHEGTLAHPTSYLLDRVLACRK